MENTQNTKETLIEAYKTPFDTLITNIEYKKKQYEKGLEEARLAKEVHIAINGAWGSTRHDGSSVTAYEILGLHACTADLLQGFLDGGATIIDHRIEYEWRNCGECGYNSSLNAFKEHDGKCPRCGHEPLPLIKL